MPDEEVHLATLSGHVGWLYWAPIPIPSNNHSCHAIHRTIGYPSPKEPAVGITVNTVPVVWHVLFGPSLTDYRKKVNTVLCIVCFGVRRTPS